MDLKELDDELRMLMGPMLADRAFGDPALRHEAINWACDLMCTQLGLTLNESTMTVTAGDVVLPDGLVKVIRVMSAP